MSGIEKLQIDHAQVFYILDLILKKMFCMEILLILSKFHQKFLSVLEISKFFVQGGGFTCILFPHLWTQC